MKKWFKRLTVAITMAAIITTVFIAVPAFASESSTKDLSDAKVTVQVYVNNYDEEFIKNVEFDDGTIVGDYDYTIEYVNNISRDAYYIPEYFEYCAWISREDPNGHNISLSLDPKLAVRYDATKKDAAWNALADPYGGAASNSYWPTNAQKLETFHWQYDCHFIGAKEKDCWNIEPTRTANSYLSVLAAKCNP